MTWHDKVQSGIIEKLLFNHTANDSRLCKSNFDFANRTLVFKKWNIT